MSNDKNTRADYQTLSFDSKKKNEIKDGDSFTLKPPQKNKQKKDQDGEAGDVSGLISSYRKTENLAVKEQLKPAVKEETKTVLVETETTLKVRKVEEDNREPLTYSEEQKQRKMQKTIEKDEKLLDNDRWFVRSGHLLTYIGLFLFAVTVYFRPYEWVPGMQGFTSIALIFAVVTLLIYLPTQLSTEGSLTILTTEVKCIIFLAIWSVLTMPIAKDPGLAWSTYNELYIKIILVFIVMVNALRTKERLKGLMWLSIAVGVMLGFQALQLYQAGEFEIEGYRVNPDFGGMFGNPNDTALHLVIFTPVSVVLGLASKSKLGKIVYFSAAVLMVAGNFVMQSRGGFLGLIAVSTVLVWKLSKKNRVVVITSAVIVGLAVITFAPGNYWLRIASIIDPSLDPVGSSDQRKELLQRSIEVTLRNPLGIGLGNFPIVGIRNLQTHNAFTQVSSELGWIGLLAYLIFLISPLRKLGAMERQMFSKDDTSWMYYLSIGLQASIVGYMVSSFCVGCVSMVYLFPNRLCDLPAKDLLSSAGRKRRKRNSRKQFE